MRSFPFVAVLAVLLLSSTNLPERIHADEGEPHRLRVELVDGSRLIGETTRQAFELDVGFDEITIPLTKMRRLEREDKAKTVRIQLQNEDVYSGTLQADPVPLKTIFGDVQLKIEQILMLEVFPEDSIGWLPSRKGLVLYYPMDDGVNVVNHAADKHHVAGTNLKWVQRGLRDGALQFGGTGQISVPHHADLCPQAFTVSAWLYPIGSTKQYQVAWAKTRPGSWTPGYGLVRYAGDDRHLYFFVNSYSSYHVKVAVPPDTWTHFTGVFDGSVLTAYINGKNAGSRDLRKQLNLPADKPVITHVDSPLTIGSDGHHYGWNGLIDEFVLYNRALEPADVQRLFEIVPAHVLRRANERTAREHSGARKQPAEPKPADEKDAALPTLEG